MRIRVLLTIVATMLAVAAAPSTASAGGLCGNLPGACIETTMDTAPSYLGWGAISSFCSKRGATSWCTPELQCTGGDTGGACFATSASSILAYRWTGRAWVGVRIASDTRMGATYLYPYGSGWSWMWRPATGWLAIRSQFAVARVHTACINCN